MVAPPRRKRSPSKGRARRDACRELVRGEPIVQRVLEATLEELARAGYKALRMEDVALSAGVNKTTVYRRWPEKAGLVRDALSTLSKDVIVLPDTGSLRGDLIALGRAMAEIFAASRGQCVMRMLVAEGSDPEVADIKRAMRQKHEAVPRAVIAAAVARGELSPDRDHAELFDAFMGALQHRIFHMNEPVPDAFLERLADLLLHGALRCQARAGKVAESRPPRASAAGERVSRRARTR